MLDCFINFFPQGQLHVVSTKNWLRGQEPYHDFVAVKESAFISKVAWNKYHTLCIPKTHLELNDNQCWKIFIICRRIYWSSWWNVLIHDVVHYSKSHRCTSRFLIFTIPIENCLSWEHCVGMDKSNIPYCLFSNNTMTENDIWPQNHCPFWYIITFLLTIQGTRKISLNSKNPVVWTSPQSQ